MKWSHRLLAAASAAALLFSACASNNVTVDDSLGKFFDSAGVKGDFALLDNGQGRFTIYNLSRYRDSMYSPGATYDIPLSLIAFQTGVAKDGNDVMDSAVTIAQAFKTVNEENYRVFQKLAHNVGLDTLKKWVDSLHYGNRDLSGDPDGSGYWLHNNLKISADEQLGLTKKLYFNQLHFFRRPQDLVKEMMIKESNSNYTLVYKLGVVPEKSHDEAWVMGWVEENKHPYFFVLNIVAPNPDTGIKTTGLQLAKRILASQGFFQGKK